MANLVGQTIAHYRIDSLLGKGGMGTVYRAYDINLKSEVAFKVMHEQFTQQPEFQRRFMQEAQAEANLRDHPSIVTIYEFNHKQGLLYMAMELVPNGTLQDYIRRKQAHQGVKLRETLHLLAHVADALDHAHRRDIIHRDIKPSNILIRKLDQPERLGEPPLRAVVTDFGLAKLREGGLHTRSGVFLGSLPYMSPEQCRGEPLQGQSDIYSLGIVLYQLATGRLPFDVKSPTEAVYKHLQVTPPDPCSIYPALPDTIKAIILKALAKEPGERIEGAALMAQSLRDVLGHLSDDVVTAYNTQAEPFSITTTHWMPEGDVPQGPKSPDISKPPSEDSIVAQGENQQPVTFSLTASGTTIGRTAENDIILSDSRVSGTHARVEADETGYHIVDLGSTNGTFLDDARLMANVAQAWPFDSRVRVGHTWLTLKRGAPSRGTIVDHSGLPIPEGDIHTSAGKAWVALHIEATDLAVEPGGAVQVPVVLLNQGSVVDHFTVTVDGIPDDWVSCPEDTMLLHGEQQRLTISLHPPRAPQSRAGEYPITVRATSQNDPGQFAEIRKNLMIHPYHQFHSAVRPKTLRATAYTTRLTIENQGNIDDVFNLSWPDLTSEVAFKLSKPHLEVQAGKTEVVEVSARPRRKLFGGETPINFNLDVKSSQGESQSLPVIVLSQAWLPAWMPTFIAMLAILLCAVVGLSAVTPVPPTWPWEEEVTTAVAPGSEVVGVPLVTEETTAPVTKEPTVELGDTPLPTEATEETLLTTEPTAEPPVMPTQTSIPTPKPTLPPTPTPIPEAPKIVSFRVEPVGFIQGTVPTIRLFWETVGADVVAIDQGVGNVEVTGSRDVPAPAVNTTYILVAKNAGGETPAQAQVRVAPFTVTMTDVSVKPSSFSGPCPKEFVFTAGITTNGPGTVKYQWERSDGSTSEISDVSFDTAEVNTVNGSWMLSGVGSHWGRLHIFTPNEILSDQVNFTLVCKATLPETSAVGPALMVKDERLLLSWIGVGNQRLNFLTSMDGIQFSNKVVLGETSPDATTLSIFRDRFVVGWTGSGQGNLNIMQSTDGQTWTNKVTLQDTSQSSPSLAVFNGNLYLAWRGVENNKLNVMRSSEGETWSNKVILNDTTASGPAIIEFNSRLLLAWRGVGNNKLNIMQSSDGVSFSDKVTLADTTLSKPYFYVHGGQVHLAWQGTNQALNVLESDNGKDWRNKRTLQERCIGAPVLSRLNQNFVWGWTGTNQRLNTLIVEW